MNRLPRGTRMRKVHTKRYQKQVPGHHIQMDVKFLTFIGKKGEKVRRFGNPPIFSGVRHLDSNILNLLIKYLKFMSVIRKYTRSPQNHSLL